VGRKTKLTPELQADIVKCIEAMQSYTSTCHYCGISQDSFTRWMQNKADFADAVKKAEAKVRIALMKDIKEAGKKQWQAMAWILERRFPDEFALKVKHTGNEGGPVEHKHSLSAEDRALLEDIRNHGRKIAGKT
jgi:hypothetical protein